MFSLEEAIRYGSENGAKFFSLEKLGRLTVGRKATFLIARGTLQQLPRKLSYREGIYVDGGPRHRLSGKSCQDGVTGFKLRCPRNF
ncbi:amidohydrolase family protein [Hydrosulfovibrio ferrireducens]|uniref:amidohydrolase family protein n=1 Tax=Hydrosulfovibrio ferrireducens TaxID=2934181 RepID=UPI003BF8181A